MVTLRQETCAVALVFIVLLCTSLTAVVTALDAKATPPTTTPQKRSITQEGIVSMAQLLRKDQLEAYTALVNLLSVEQVNAVDDALRRSSSPPVAATTKGIDEAVGKSSSATKKKNKKKNANEPKTEKQLNEEKAADAKAAEQNEKRKDENAKKNAAIDKKIATAKAKVPKKFVWRDGKQKPSNYKEREELKKAKKEFYREKAQLCRDYKKIKKEGDDSRPIDFKGGDEDGNVDPREHKEILKTLRAKAKSDSGMADLLKKGDVSQEEPKPKPKPKHTSDHVGDLDDDDCYDDDDDDLEDEL